MGQRFNAYETSIYDFIKEIEIVCPNCSKRAKVSGLMRDPTVTRAVCTSCGFNKMLEETPSDSPHPWVSRVYFIAGQNDIGAIDPYFNYQLWYQKELRHGLLWAYNAEHLALIEKHVSATLRERNLNNMRNNSLGSRLPKWLTAKKNREEIIAEILKLKLK